MYLLSSSNCKYESLAIVWGQVMKQFYALYVFLCSFHCDLVKPPLNLGHVWLITSHKNVVCDYSSMSYCISKRCSLWSDVLSSGWYRPCLYIYIFASKSHNDKPWLAYMLSLYKDKNCLIYMIVLTLFSSHFQNKMTGGILGSFTLSNMTRQLSVLKKLKMFLSVLYLQQTEKIISWACLR